MADQRFRIVDEKLGRDCGGGSGHEIAGLVVIAEEKFDLPAKRRIASAVLLDVSGSFRWCTFERRVENVRATAVTLRLHPSLRR